MKMNPTDLPEQSLKILEKLTGPPITIIDNDGIFNLKQRRRVFSFVRASHKKNPVCRCGFSDRCIEHCRFQMNRRCLENDRPFAAVCWKGVCQLVIPLQYASVHYGMLYAGVFRDRKIRPPKGLTRDFYRLYRALPLWNEAEMKKLIPLLKIQADGILAYLREFNIVNDDYDLRRSRITEFLNRNLDHGIGLPDLAENLSLSPSHTSLLVKKLFGISFSEYLMRLRVDRVQHYLGTTDLNLHEIASRCGFSSEFHLSRTFSRFQHMPPSVYRKINFRRKD